MSASLEVTDVHKSFDTGADRVQVLAGAELATAAQHGGRLQAVERRCTSDRCVLDDDLVGGLLLSDGGERQTSERTERDRREAERTAAVREHGAS